MLTVEELRVAVDAGEIDTVLVAIVDMQGRLQGKRCAAQYFLDEVLGHSAEGCNYLLAVDVEMNPVSGFEMSSWERGYGDFVMKPDVETLRRVPWQEGTALVMCDVVWENGDPVVASPRQVLRKQLDRLAALGLDCYVGTELEFILFDDSYEQAWNAGYRNLTPSNQYNVDYSLLGTARVEPLLRAIRNGMTGAGMVVESAKGECNPGQHEIAFKYTTALRTCDQHAIYKNGSKEIASQQGKALTFMAKYNEREGNSCHIHLSLRSKDGEPVFAEGHGMSQLMKHFLAGQLAGLRELTYFLAPNVNSYKRFVQGSFAPTAVAWGRDNRTCALRVVGHGHGLRFENRVPGGDVNPYLAVAALIAAGLHGVEQELELEDEFVGNAYASDRPTVPTTLREAAELLEASEIARAAFGQEVVDHYLNAAKVELTAFDAAVTDWEKVRGFERL
ncbi:glutamine synthetase family protein [Lentzea flaviverrucosa]|uniref:Glutamine synthetase n=1 Tax=Lentzea flaviverrucosa TaxID=200379 RepID=A0A1H9SSW1_9PSEU|nr:glutamine synthetase family protein [Lentzea flaviverrucosa]RDI25507.1 L-glutamine synthetase [Lentzea flaviverrucosa]SER87954.1 glutamine synthetase [Lentzea flaviverrucosa]